MSASKVEVHLLNHILNENSAVLWVMIDIRVQDLCYSGSVLTSSRAQLVVERFE